MIILGILVLIALTAQWIAPYDPYQVLIGVEPVKQRQAPCIHLLGCPRTSLSTLPASTATCAMSSAACSMARASAC